jgi:hypothetical protein
MLRAVVSKVYRDMIVGHSLKGLDAYYIKPDDDDLKRAMDVYTAWFDEQLEAADRTKESASKVASQ